MSGQGLEVSRHNAEERENEILDTELERERHHEKPSLLR